MIACIGIIIIKNEIKIVHWIPTYIHNKMFIKTFIFGGIIIKQFMESNSVYY